MFQIKLKKKKVKISNEFLWCCLYFIKMLRNEQNPLKQNKKKEKTKEEGEILHFVMHEILFSIVSKDSSGIFWSRRV